MTTLGIDLGSTSIKAVQVTKKGKTPIVERVAIASVAGSLVQSEAQDDRDELIRVIKKTLHDAGINHKEVAISLQESQVFTRVIETPHLSEKELHQAIQWEAERYIPLPLAEVNMDFSILSDTANKSSNMDVLLVASPIHLVEKYAEIFDRSGLEVDAIENEALPILRAYEDSTINTMVVDIGGSNTNVFLMNKELLVLVRSLSVGSNAYTKALVQELNLPQNQAEEYKRTYGLDKDQMEGKLFASLSPLAETMTTELQNSLTYFREKYPEEVVNRIVLTGGGAYMPGLSALFAERLQVEIVYGNPWQQLSVSDAVLNQYKGFESVFAVATGLALRGSD